MTYTYWLEDVSTTGVATRHAPVSVTFGGEPSAVGMTAFGAAGTGGPALAGLAALALAVAGGVALRRRVVKERDGSVVRR